MQITAGDVTLRRILLERAFELDAEQMRWFDLARTGKLIERVTLYNAQSHVGWNISGRTKHQAFHIHRPIPQAQSDRTLGGYPQNEGY